MRAPAWTLILLITSTLAGCADDPRSGLEPTGPEKTRTTHPDFPGLVVEGRLSRGDDGMLRIDAEARNEGPRTYRVSAICQPPWSEAMEGPDGPVQPHEPAIYCLAFGLADFPPGATLRHETTWDGKLWDDESGEPKPAPPGLYVWSILFRAYSGGEGPEFDDSAELRLAFEVTVD